MKIDLRDILIIVPVSVLLMFGIIMVTSSSIYVADDLTSNPFHFAQRQVIFIAVGFLAMIFFLVIPSELLYKADWIFMLISILLLALLFVPDVGTSVNGSIRWIRLGPINIQPSEICKFSLILYISGYSVRRMTEINSLRSVIILGGLYGGIFTPTEAGAAAASYALFYGLILICLDSFRKNRLFQGYAVFGIFLLLVVQTLFNISVNIGLLPTKGLTLPFISYGGTSIIIMLSLIGIVLRINNENKAI